MGHALMENRNGLIVDCEVTKASGTAEREAALTMIKRSRKGKARAVRKTRVTLGADKGFDAEDFVLALKAQKVTPHIAINARTYPPAASARPPSMAVPPGTRAMRSASAAASASRRASAGPKP